MPKFLNVIVPLAIDGTLTYYADDTQQNICVGVRVLVQVGKKKIYTGIVEDVFGQQPETPYSIKPIICVLDDVPLLSDYQLKLWHWISSYYMCSLGEIYKAALPAMFKLESETRVSINDDFVAQRALPNNMSKILDVLADKKQHSLDELARQIEVKSVVKQINLLIELGAVIIDEHVAEKYKPKTVDYIGLNNDINSSQQLQDIFNSLRRAPKQLQLLEIFLDFSRFNDTFPHRQEILKSDLIAYTSPTILKQLIDKRILSVVTKEVVDIKSTDDNHLIPSFNLNQYQQQAYDAINTAWEEKDVVLLHGVTSSGKTEVYIKLIEQQLKRGKQVLYLLPEIALTTQLTERLRRVFGNTLGVYHSKYSDHDRAEIYRGIIKGKYQVVLGVRSSVFLPLNNLGLIIVDEEHDQSYKQQDPAPRYSARDTAIMMAHILNAKVLLGTATPAVETYQNAVNGKYGLVSITKRYKDIQLPQINIVDMNMAYKRKEFVGHLSDVLIQQIKAALDAHSQIILFQNRRGFASYLSCQACGFVPKCVNCDVSLTVHKRQQLLSCHYCGYTIPIVEECPSCHQKTLVDHGLGTERVEEEVKSLFPHARVARMDLDTTRTRRSYENLINDFAAHNIDILIGTQMVTKGLHFDDVSLVAVLNADSLLNQPDFRSYERAYQMLEQVSGRAGRTGKQGLVYIQTRQCEDLLFQQVKKHDFIGFFHAQIDERKMFKYPPYFRLMSINIKHRSESSVRYVAELLQKNLAQIFGKRVSTVIVPVVGWVQNMFIRQITIRIESNASLQKAKNIINEQIAVVKNIADGKNANIYVDVDPV